jgi:N-acetylmuramoyl-L-alanine amidase CwlA
MVVHNIVAVKTIIQILPVGQNALVREYRSTKAVVDIHDTNTWSAAIQLCQHATE